MSMRQMGKTIILGTLICASSLLGDYAQHAIQEKYPVEFRAIENAISSAFTPIHHAAEQAIKRYS